MNITTPVSPESSSASCNGAELAIRELARKHNVSYLETPTDVLGSHFTRLAGDDPTLDDTERLLLALERAGHVSGREAVKLHANYLRQAKL